MEGINIIKELEIEVSRLKAEVKYLIKENTGLRKDKEYLQDQLEQRLISIETQTSFLRNVFTTPKAKDKKAPLKEKTYEEKVLEFQAFLLKKSMRDK